MGVFYYGRVIGGLAIFEGTKHQYPLYDTLAMGIQMMLFSYLLGRTDSQERSVIEIWADSRATTRLGSSLLSIVAIVAIGHALYLGVFAPHLATKLLGLVTVGPTEQLRSEERRVGKEGVSTCVSRGVQYHIKKKKK